MQNRKVINRDRSIKLNNFLSLEKINLGFAAESVIKHLIKCDVVIVSQTKIFRKRAMKFIISMLIKLFQRSALRSALLRFASIFLPHPASYLIYQNISYKKRFKYLLKYLIETYVLVPKTCDQVVTGFNNFPNNEVKKQKIEFLGFEVENKLHDHFTIKKFKS